MPVCEGDLVSQYLAGRGLGDWKPNDDFQCLNHSVIHSGQRIGSPGLIAMVRSPDGEPATIHQTPIVEGNRYGKRYLSRGSFPDGSAIRLDPAAETMGIAEGIESAKSASITSGLPTWALLNAQNLAKFALPDICKKLIIFADFDASFVGQATAYGLARKLTNSKTEIEVSFAQYGRTGFDWNDWLIKWQNNNFNSENQTHSQKPERAG